MHTKLRRILGSTISLRYIPAQFFTSCVSNFLMHKDVAMIFFYIMKMVVSLDDNAVKLMIWELSALKL